VTDGTEKGSGESILISPFVVSEWMTGNPESNPKVRVADHTGVDDLKPQFGVT
jgi:hypothetical protein